MGGGGKTALQQSYPTTGWQWPWRRALAGEACLRLLVGLPLRLLREPESEAPLIELLATLERQLSARRAWLLLPGDEAGGLRLLGSPGDCPGCGDCPGGGEAARLPAAGVLMHCASCLAAGRQRLICGITDGNGRAGALLLDFFRPPRPAQRAMLREVGQALGETLQALAEERRQQRRELAAERGVLSRELHDSVAQQLGYLQIRACRLQAVLDDPARQGQAVAMLDDLRATLHLVHRQVRELIATARLTMDGGSLRQALNASVEEFARRSGCVFELDNRLPAARLCAEAELQVLQVVREALANAVRHSQARRVRILLHEPDGRGVEVLVEDDGVGLPAQLPEDGHYGLRIMRERAAAIGAQLDIGAAVPRGTRIRLHLQGRKA